MALFLVTKELQPGVSRADVGFIKPGQSFAWPGELVKNDGPSLKLRPMDQSAYDMLVEQHGQEKVTKKWGEKFESHTPEVAKEEKPKSMADISRNLAGEIVGKKKRLSDS